jgi:cytochrome d ubiquinol oxidase subunit II
VTALQVTWFVLVAVLLTGYAVLDGFDLGVGFWHLFARGDRDRRVLLNAIGPVWDGNEVWLITGAGALFAAFPPVYASVFSGMYLALMLLLVGLVLRAVSLEFRSKVDSPRWRTTWDAAFSVGSVVSTLVLGVAAGNIIGGLHLDAHGTATDGFLDLLDLTSVLVGLTGLAMFATHGAAYLSIKTEGDLHRRALSWAMGAWFATAALFAATTALSLAVHRQLLDNFLSAPALFVLPAVASASILAIPLLLRRGAARGAFLATSLSIAGLMATAGASIFPHMVPSATDPALGLTIFDSSSSRRTLTVMLVLAAIGVPVMLGYTVFAYRTFRGKVVVEDHGY